MNENTTEEIYKFLDSPLSYGQAFFIRAWETDYVRKHLRTTPKELRDACVQAIISGEIKFS